LLLLLLLLLLVGWHSTCSDKSSVSKVNAVLILYQSTSAALQCCHCTGSSSSCSSSAVRPAEDLLVMLVPRYFNSSDSKRRCGQSKLRLTACRVGFKPLHLFALACEVATVGLLLLLLLQRWCLRGL
jgi:hypothetical protein